jgi:hypothetical protein
MKYMRINDRFICRSLCTGESLQNHHVILQILDTLDKKTASVGFELKTACSRLITNGRHEQITNIHSDVFPFDAADPANPGNS